MRVNMVSPHGSIDPRAEVRSPTVGRCNDAVRGPPEGRPLAAGLPLVGMDAVRARFLARNLDPSVVDVILQARKQVTWVTYLRYWDKFVAFCAERSIDPWTADIGQILSHVES